MTGTTIYDSAGQQGAANLHLHDQAITISAGDVSAGRLPLLRARLEAEVDAMVERINAEMVQNGSGRRDLVSWHVSYDGARNCGAHER